MRNTEVPTPSGPVVTKTLDKDKVALGPFVTAGLTIADRFTVPEKPP